MIAVETILITWIDCYANEYLKKTKQKKKQTNQQTKNNYWACSGIL